MRRLLVLTLALLVGLPTAAFAPPPGVTAARERTYYIAADEVDWDYAPSGRNEITGEAFDDEAQVFVEPGEGRIGRIYRKALYREYTDETFATPMPVDPRWAHLGTLGPVIRAEVGDTIRVVFKNNARFPFSLHPHGALYDKRSEGAPYADGTDGADTRGDAVPPGELHTYRWEVPERVGPGPNDPSSILWMYHSHVDESDDTNAGLVGPLIISRRGTLRDDKPEDVDREFVLLFTVFDENHSPYLEHNLRTFAGQPGTVERDDEGFLESNLKHAINGYLYGNLPLEALTMRRGERVRWYVLGMGTEVDLHTAHWHAQTLLWMGMRTDMIELLPASMKTLDMEPDNPGTWLLHCHVNDHLDAGMLARFRVE